MSLTPSGGNVCSICGKPFEGEHRHPNAVLSHFECLQKLMDEKHASNKGTTNQGKQ